MVGVLLDPWRPCPARARTTTLPAITTSTTSSAPMLASQRLRPDCPGCPVDCCTSICSVSGCRVCIENLLHSDRMMNFDDHHRLCHAERSEESDSSTTEGCFASLSVTGPDLVVKVHRCVHMHCP